MIFITLIVIPIVVIIAISEFASTTVYGSYLTDNEYFDILKKNIDAGVSVNQFNPTILTFGRLPFVSTHMTPIFSKYYISGVGRIPRWSKMHKLIKEQYLNRYK